MGKVLINKWNGGVSIDTRPQTTNENSEARNFDIWSDNSKLTAIRQNTLDTNQSGNQDCYVHDAVKRSDGKFIGWGQTSSVSTAPRFYRKNSDDITSYWRQSSVAGSGIPYYNGAVSYKTNVYGLSGQSGGGNALLYRYDGDATITSIGTISDYASTVPKMIVHPQDNVLYIGVNKTIAKYDGTTFTASAITLPYQIYSICDYGSYLAIGCQTATGGKIYLWGRDTSLTTLQEVIEVDRGQLFVIENLGGVLYSVSTSNGAESNYSGGFPTLIS